MVIVISLMLSTAILISNENKEKERELNHIQMNIEKINRENKALRRVVSSVVELKIEITTLKTKLEEKELNIRVEELNKIHKLREELMIKQLENKIKMYYKTKTENKV